MANRQLFQLIRQGLQLLQQHKRILASLTPEETLGLGLVVLDLRNTNIKDINPDLAHLQLELEQDTTRVPESRQERPVDHIHRTLPTELILESILIIQNMSLNLVQEAQGRAMHKLVGRVDILPLLA